jgi:hypothetical protein
MGYQEGDCTREPTRTIDDAVDEVEASGIQKKPGEINGNQHPASHRRNHSNRAR